MVDYGDLECGTANNDKTKSRNITHNNRRTTTALLFLSDFFLSSFKIYPCGSDVKPGEVCLIPTSFTHREKKKNKCIMKHFYGSHNNSKDFLYYIKSYKNDFNHLTP